MTGPRPTGAQYPRGTSISGEGAGRAPVHRPSNGAPARNSGRAWGGDSRGKGAWGYTCQAATNTRPRNCRDSVTKAGRSVTRSLLPESALRLPPCPSQTKAIHTHRHFPLTSKTTSSSNSGVILLRHATRLSTMGNEGGRTGGTPASPTDRRFCPENYNSQNASQVTPPFQDDLLEQSKSLWAGGAGAGGSSSPLIGGGWSFCPPFTAATSRGRLKHWFLFFFFF